MRKVYICFVFILTLQIAYSQNPSIDRRYGSNGFGKMGLGAPTSTDNVLTQMENTGNGKLLYIANALSRGKRYIGRVDSSGKKDFSFGTQGATEIIDPNNRLSELILVKHPNLFETIDDQASVAIGRDNSTEIVLHKFDKRGRYDNFFGTNGIKRVPLPKVVQTLNKALHLPGSKILVLFTGYDVASPQDKDLFVIRLDANGVIDPSFGNGGITVLEQMEVNCTNGACHFKNEDIGSEVVYTSDSKILVTGTLLSDNSSITSVICLTSNGHLDKSFGIDGQISRGAVFARMSPVATNEQGGKGYVVSFNRKDNRITDRFSYMVRYTKQGAEDFTFPYTQLPTINGSKNYGILATALQSDQKIVALCAAGDKKTPYLVRVKSNGGIDSTFGTNGVYIFDTLGVSGFGAQVEEPRSFLSLDINRRINLGTFVSGGIHESILFTRLISDEKPQPLVMPVAISAGQDQTICSGSTTNIGTAAVDGYSYSWTSLPIGFNSSIANPSINPKSNTAYYLAATDAQGNSTLDTVMITVTATTSVLKAEINIIDPLSCSGEKGALLSSTYPTGNQWYRNGAIITGEKSQTLKASQSGTYHIVITLPSGCVTDPSNTIAITIGTPVKPVVTQSGNQLTSSATTGNQWYLNNNPILGAINQLYTPQITGSYTVRGTVSGCTGTSDPFQFSITQLPSVDSLPVWSENISIFPNPVSDVLKVNNPDLLKIEIRLANSTGNVSYQKTTSDATISIDLRSNAPGIYWLIITDTQTGESYNKLLLKL